MSAPETDTADDATESFRPALERLTLDVADMRTALFDGFDDRTAVLRWERRLVVRTLGELPDRVIGGVARQYRIDTDSAEAEPTLLAALLEPDARRRDLADDAARALRERFWGTFVVDAYHRAFRKLRKDTGEYFDREETGPAGHDPRVQAYVAMRPALDELEAYQQQALDECLAGFADGEAILEWAETVEQATHGELPDRFVARCYDERSTRRLLTGDLEGASTGRELFAARFLLPAFNEGVRDLAGRTGETPADDSPRADGVHL